MCQKDNDERVWSEIKKYRMKERDEEIKAKRIDLWIERKIHRQLDTIHR